MSKHTPGEWFAGTKINGEWFVGEWEHAGDDYSYVVKVTSRPRAHLIAAAPDLLAAAKAAMIHVGELREAWRTGAISEHDGQGGTRSNRNVEIEVGLRAAIAKAEGETP